MKQSETVPDTDTFGFQLLSQTLDIFYITLHNNLHQDFYPSWEIFTRATLAPLAPFCISVGSLTHLGQPPLVPSSTPDNPPWSPHSPRRTPLGLLTCLGQLIKSDLVHYFVDMGTHFFDRQTNITNLVYEKNWALRALIFSAPAGRARSLRELGAFGPPPPPAPRSCLILSSPGRV